MQSIVTSDWRSMGSDVQHIEWVLCIDTNAVITVYFLIWWFFLYSTFLFGCYITKLLCDQILNISIVVCVVMVMMKLQFFFILTFLVFHILYIRWELIKKKRKESRYDTLTPPFPKIDLIMDHTLKIFGQPCPYEKKLGWTDYDFWWWFQFMCNVPYAFNHCLCVCECVTLTCVRQDL